MPKTMITGPIDSFYFGRLSKLEACLALTNGNDRDLELLMRECVAEAFHAGARWQMRESAMMSPHIAKFLEMVILLGPDYPADAWLHTVRLPERDDEPAYEPADAWLENVPF